MYEKRGPFLAHKSWIKYIIDCNFKNQVTASQNATQSCVKMCWYATVKLFKYVYYLNDIDSDIAKSQNILEKVGS